MKYKVGDKVTLTNGNIMTIDQIDDISKWYRIKEDPWNYYTDEMIEGLVKEEVFIKANDIYNEEYSKGEYCHEQSFKWGFQEGYSYSHENDKLEISLKEGYQFKDENGNVIPATKIVLEKKKKEYPKTFRECCQVLGLNSEIEDSELLFYYPLKCGDYTTIRLPEMEKFEKFIKLYLCRNAYWKIAGEEMGLGKPWEPDYDSGVNKYGIICMNGVVQESNPTTNWERHLNKVLDFPTAEMRDTFKKNFDPDIEICKELL